MSEFQSPKKDAILRGRADCYEVVSTNCLGTGGNGYVARVRAASEGRELAAKIYKVQDENRERLLRFQIEREVMKRLNHHAIVPLVDEGEWEGRPFFVMPRARCSLMDKIKDMEALDADLFKRLCIDVTDALVLLHEQDCWHRDIKPENVLLFDEGGRLEPRLTDFGVAHLCPDFVDVAVETGKGAVPKSHYCYAPEQLRGPGDERSDIFSWAFVLWWAATCRPPRGAPSPPSQCLSGLDKYFDDILLKALDPEPNSRFATMAGLKRAMVFYYDRLPGIKAAWEQGPFGLDDGVKTTQAELTQLGIPFTWPGGTMNRSLINGVSTTDLAHRIRQARDRAVRLVLGLARPER